MNTVPASIPVLNWAAQRANLSEEKLISRFRKWPEWLSGKAHPTLKQLEDFASLTHTPIGYFFLPEPPQIELPIPDFRTLGDVTLNEPSSELLDTIYLCQQRQDWFREYAQLHKQPPVSFIGTATEQDEPLVIAAAMREQLNLSVESRQQCATWTDALRQLIIHVEEAGVLVMASSIVGSNSHRLLSVDEFRGFVLTDDFAPLIFLNAADSKSAQMFTLAHELAHCWLGESGLSDPQAGQLSDKATERWCNAVAAELLVPIADLTATYQPGNVLSIEIQRLARQFKVSTLVALRRIFDAGFIDQTHLWQAYRAEVERIRQLNSKKSGGGSFYRTLGVRTSKRFARAVMTSTLEGQTLFQDAFRMLGVRKTNTFYQAARELGVLT